MPVTSYKLGTGAMSVPLLGVILWMLGIRGSVPEYDGFGSTGSEDLLRIGSHLASWMRVLAVLVLMIGSLSLLLWTAVWLAIRLL